MRTGKTAGSSASLEVANSGPVVPDDLVPSLFEPFRRIEEAARTQDGVGLGLVIVKSISAAHAGTSRPGVDGTAVLDLGGHSTSSGGAGSERMTASSLG